MGVCGCAASVFDHPLPRLLELLGVADRLGVLLDLAVESLGGGVLGVGPQHRAEVALRVVEVCELEVRARADQVALLAIRRIQQCAAHLLDDLLRGGITGGLCVELRRPKVPFAQLLLFLRRRGGGGLVGGAHVGRPAELHVDARRLHHV